MFVINGFWLLRRVTEIFVGGIAIWLVFMLEHPNDRAATFGFSLFVSSMFPLSSLYVVSTLVLEIWNYRVRRFISSSILGLLFILHYTGLSFFVRFSHDPIIVVSLAIFGAFIVFLLNFFLRPSNC